MSYTRPISAQQLTPEQRQTVAVEVMTNGAVRNCEAVRQELLTSPDSSLNKARVLSAKQLQVGCHACFAGELWLVNKLSSLNTIAFGATQRTLHVCCFCSCEYVYMRFSTPVLHMHNCSPC